MGQFIFFKFYLFSKFSIKVRMSELVFSELPKVDWHLLTDPKVDANLLTEVPKVTGGNPKVTGGNAKVMYGIRK